MTDRPLSVLIADDHPLVLKAVEDLLTRQAHCQIVARCTNGADALAAIRTLRPDIAVLDLQMPQATGLEVLQRAIAEMLPTRIILLSASISDADVLAAISAGVHGIVLKDSAVQDLEACLRIVAAGRRSIPGELAADVMMREAQRVRQEERSGQLSAREREIVGLVREGLSNKEIARMLGIAEGTVKIHLHNIYGKFEVSNRTQLAMLSSDVLR